MHPAQAIIDRFEQVLSAAFPEDKRRIYVNRTLSLKDDEQELPATIVTMGSDDPMSDLSTFDAIGSLLSVSVSFIDLGMDERSLLESLLSRRTRAHAALMPRGALNLPWVVEVGYLGALAPLTEARGTGIAKDLTTRWQVAYRQDRYNPNVSIT